MAGPICRQHRLFEAWLPSLTPRSFVTTVVIIYVKVHAQECYELSSFVIVSLVLLMLSEALLLTYLSCPEVGCLRKYANHNPILTIRYFEDEFLISKRQHWFSFTLCLDHRNQSLVREEDFCSLAPNTKLLKRMTKFKNCQVISSD